MHMGFEQRSIYLNNPKIEKSMSQIFKKKFVTILSLILLGLYLSLVVYYLFYDASVPKEYSQLYKTSEPKSPLVIWALTMFFVNYVIVLICYYCYSKDVLKKHSVWFFWLSLIFGVIAYNRFDISSLFDIEGGSLC